MAYDPAEQDEIEKEFLKLLRLATQDGGKKRAAGAKVPWQIDPTHRDAFHRHVGRAYLDPGGRDPDSGASHWVAVAWRALALAWQETYPEERKKVFLELGYGA